MYPNAYGITSRRSHSAAIAPVEDVAPTDFAAYAPSIPHCRPRMNTSPSTITAEPVIRIPACRSVSPMKPSTRPFTTLVTILRQNLVASPNAVSASSGLVDPFIAAC
jgi:hypothetical protein